MNEIAAISTPRGTGGIGVIRVSGEKSIEIVNKIFVPFNKNTSILDLKGYHAKYGKIIKNNKFIDEAVVLIYRAPHSYTGENVVEISCHGGLFVTRQVLRAVLDAGARLAEPGEFTKRAFLNNKIDLSQAEAVMDIISAKSERANLIAFNQKDGIVTRKINKIKEKLVEICAQLSVWSDYPDEEIIDINKNQLILDLENIKNTIDNMIKNYDNSSVLKQGVKSVIIGQPNVGKSTFMNLLTGSEKSIVTDIPGTTRDIIEENIMIGDIPIMLQDTAGIRETDNIIEKIGIEKAKNSINISEIIIYILDSSKNLDNYDLNLLEKCDKNRTIIILNKTDLDSKIDKNLLLNYSKYIINFSAINGTGLEELQKSIENIIGLVDLDPSESIISNERQLEIIKKIKVLLKNIIIDINSGITFDAITVLIHDSINLIMELTGENATEEIINKIFSQFCVGK
ncbi:MAG: tRNA uridine-5-carboxymethylaminomethyl(34) synthesis GTPase MnmE [Clostridia bacterium]|nr:tRNA uridine-5-carboxymethylaminomethyl(34) synthesis GTPase MnmE [Clostridia bacterium]